jgi:hypothetical protein
MCFRFPLHARGRQIIEVMHRRGHPVVESILGPVSTVRSTPDFQYNTGASQVCSNLQCAKPTIFMKNIVHMPIVNTSVYPEFQHIRNIVPE